MIAQIVDLDTYPLSDELFMRDARDMLARDGALVLPDFILPDARAKLITEAKQGEAEAYFCAQNHNVFLTSPDPEYGDDHPRNIEVVSSKGCICDDLVGANSPLRALYDSEEFRQFLCFVLVEDELFPYADPLSSINIHYAREGQELGWHFDNSSFATTLLIDKPEGGGQFEYVKDVRNAHASESNFDAVADIFSGRTAPNKLEAEAGTLMLFRGRNSMHRVTPTEGSKTRMLAVLAYNSKPGVSLSEEARMTFYGRLG